MDTGCIPDDLLVGHLVSRGFLPNGQHGFRSMRSTLTQLLSFWDTMLTKLEEGGGSAIYLDFSKAFDKVEHGVLLHKLREFGVTGQVGLWISVFLDSSSQHQAVAVDGRISELCPVTSGSSGYGARTGAIPCTYCVHSRLSLHRHRSNFLTAITSRRTC